MRFRDRKEAGHRLAGALSEYKEGNAVIYALPRGGVVLGAEIAKTLNAPLDLVVPRKIGHPNQPEYGICAVTDGGHLVCSKREVAQLDPAWLTSEVQKEQAEAKRRKRTYLANRPRADVHGKTAIIVDDGVATGLTMLAAIEEVKSLEPEHIVLATPVIAKDVAGRLERYVNQLVALDTPEIYLGTVGAYYDQFDQVEDKQVVQLMKKAPKPKASARQKH